MSDVTGCEKEVWEQRLSDHEREIHELKAHVQQLDTRTAEHGGLIKSVDSRITELVKDTSAQTVQLKQISDDSSEQNSEILHRVANVENTLIDFTSNGAESTKQLRTVKENVATLEQSFKNYVEANSENMKTVETIDKVVVRIETFMVGAYGEIKATAKKMMKIALLIFTFWAMYKLFPGLKPIVENALKVGSLAE